MRYLALVTVLLSSDVHFSCRSHMGLHIRIRSDRVAYLRPSDTSAVLVRYDIRNDGWAPAFLEGCPDPVPMVLEQEVDGLWQQAERVNIICQATHASARMQVAAGQHHEYALEHASTGRFRVRLLYGVSEAKPRERSVYSDAYRIE
jgi:hypothetical protein